MSFAPPVVFGNWKMNGLRAEGEALVRRLIDRRRSDPGRGTLGVFPPATLLAPLAGLLEGSDVRLGGQDCHPERSGAFTGDLSAAMLKDAGAEFVIVGHSERRHGHGESDGLVRRKAQAALGEGLGVVLCIGETEAEHEAGRTLAVLDRQLDGSLPAGATAAALVVAYEPVWAIGTGRSATPEDIRRAHGHVRRRLAERVPEGAAVRLLYGGSVKAANAGEIMACPDVEGVLVGGASLDADEFWAIFEAGRAAVA